MFGKKQPIFRLERDPFGSHSQMSDLETIVSMSPVLAVPFLGVVMSKQINDPEYNLGLASLLAGLGFLSGVYISRKISSFFKNRKRRRLNKKEDLLDYIGECDGRPYADFRYRGNKVRCVLREAYEDYDRPGHTFDMTGDDVIENPRFSYNPCTPQVLHFGFSFKKEPVKKNNALCIYDTLSPKDQKLLIRIENLSREMPRGFEIVASASNEDIQVSIGYSGGDYFKLLPQFSEVVSRAMERVYHSKKPTFFGSLINSVTNAFS